jgi:hypothetical protein
MPDESPDMTGKPLSIPGTNTEQPSAPETARLPATLFQQLLFGLSLPERAVRSTTALVGGTLQEATLILIPPAFRSSRSYTMFIQQSLDFLLTEVGNVERADPAAASQKDLIARKAVGGFLDLAGVATLHLSPMTVLALVSDIAYGSSAYLKELSDELKKVGVIDQNTTIDHAKDLLDAIQNASKVSSQALDAPPLSVDGLKDTIAQTTEAVRRIDPTKLLPQSELQKMWGDIRDIAGKEGVSPFEVSSTLALHAASKVGTLGQGALSSVTVAGNMFDRHILDHYRTGLDSIRKQGLFSMLAATYGPYTSAVWNNFSSSKGTVTEDLFSGRLLGKAWDSVSGWWKKPEEE